MESFASRDSKDCKFLIARCKFGEYCQYLHHKNIIAMNVINKLRNNIGNCSEGDMCTKFEITRLLWIYDENEVNQMKSSSGHAESGKVDESC